MSPYSEFRIIRFKKKKVFFSINNFKRYYNIQYFLHLYLWNRKFYVNCILYTQCLYIMLRSWKKKLLKILLESRKREIVLDVFKVSQKTIFSKKQNNNNYFFYFHCYFSIKSYQKFKILLLFSMIKIDIST